MGKTAPSPRSRGGAAVLLLAVASLLAPPYAYGDPPPWAPAHGWRKKHDPYYVGYTGHKWPDHYGVIDGRCNREAVGAVIGATVGGVVGSQVGKGDGRAVATVLGAVFGAVIGAAIGRDMDRTDRACFGHALELAKDNQRVTWVNPDTKVTYAVTPGRGYKSGEQPCREYTTRATFNGKNETVKGKACRGNDGEWRAVDS